MVEKIEIYKRKGNNSIYTGTLRELGNGWVEIHTVQDEVLRFRKDQVESRIEWE